MNIPWKAIKKEMQDFLCFCSIRRSIQIRCKFINEKEYLSCENRRDRLYDELKALIPSEAQEILFEYRHANLRAIHGSQSYFYEKGFEDGFCTFNVLNNKSNEFYELMLDEINKRQI